LPLNFTLEVVMNPVPFTVSVNAAPPAVAFVGTSVVIVGAGLLIVNVCAADVPPPGVGFVTVTGTLPAVAISAAVIAAVICVALTNVVVCATPLKFATDPVMKPVPFSVNVNAAPPAVALVGAIDVSVGAGFAPLTGKLTVFDVPPPGAGFVTVTGNVPAVEISLARIAAVICVALTKVVARALPLKFTTDVDTNPVPFTVNVNAAPPVAAFGGESVVITGVGARFVSEKFATVAVDPVIDVVTK
jgi:hypothetical protein